MERLDLQVLFLAACTTTTLAVCAVISPLLLHQPHLSVVRTPMAILTLLTHAALATPRMGRSPRDRLDGHRSLGHWLGSAKPSLRRRRAASHSGSRAILGMMVVMMVVIPRHAIASRLTEPPQSRGNQDRKSTMRKKTTEKKEEVKKG